MVTLSIALGSLILYIIAYNTYGKWLGQKIFKLEKNLSRLASIAGAAPMIGFFGTVTGMILAFYKMSEAGNVGPKELASGIYVALITTAVGLAIGIFAFIGYNLLVANVEKVIFKMERTTTEFMDLLQEPAS